MIKKHWSPRYIVNRVKNFYFEKSNPDLPWINPQAIKIFEGLLTKKDVGIEFGSGSSTVWFSKKVKELTSIEDHKEWFDKINKQIEKTNTGNIKYLFKSTEAKTPEESDYCKYLENIKDNSVDFIIVDGKYRDVLALMALNKVKTGGFVFLDDSQRYIPHKTYSPYSIRNNVDNISKNWIEFNEKTKFWRRINTTNGVSDATFFIKNM